MSQNKLNIGTILSFKDFPDDTYDTLCLILDKKQRRDGYIGNSYLLYFINRHDEFWINEHNLKSEIDNGEWVVEYEPE